MNAASWVARLQGVDYCSFIGSKIQQLCCFLTLDFDTPVIWARHFSDFLGVYSSLAPLSSNFFSVSTRCLYFCFLSIKSPVVLSLFTKSWIVCLLGTLSSWNLRRNFRQNFLIDPVFLIGVIQKYTLLWSIPHHDVPHRWVTAAENKFRMELITAAYCWQIINKLPHMNHTARRET
jgi:hypothetical protein